MGIPRNRWRGGRGEHRLDNPCYRIRRGEPPNRNGKGHLGAGLKTVRAKLSIRGQNYTFDVYELAGTQWKQLPSVVEKATTVNQLVERALAKDRKRIHAKKGASNSVMTIWKVLRWIDNDTFEGYASEQLRVHGSKADELDDDWEYFGCAVSYKVKCDNRGAWKIVASHELSEAENDKLFKDND